MQGEGIRELFEACGATRYLQPVPVECRRSSEQLTKIRRKAGLERSSWDRRISDVTLRGLDALLSLLSSIGRTERRQRTALLWEALADVESRRGSRPFVVSYTWSYSHETKTVALDAAFVKRLQEREWVPDAEGTLHVPKLVAFDSLGWKPNPFLLSKIRFKPPIIDQLAKEIGIEPGVLDLLKKLGVTSEADLRKRLGVKEEPTPQNEAKRSDVENALKSSPSQGERGSTKAEGSGQTGRTSGGAGGRPFISDVGTHPDGENSEFDGLDQAARMALEAKAIEFILSRETEWQRTPTHNPGFDLYETGPDAQPRRWCEVKAMTGSLTDRPVGLSRTQFDCAREHGDAYWLYVVERTGTDRARIVRIQDPAGNARTFTFDHGWLDVAKLDSEEGRREN